MTKQQVAKLNEHELQAIIHAETRFYFNGYKCKSFRYVRSTAAFHCFTNGEDAIGNMKLLRVMRK